MPSLKGGSQGEPTRQTSHPFFFPEIKVLEFRSKDIYGARILPSFDHKLTEGSPEFRVSYVPYRDIQQPDAHGVPTFSAWYYVLQGYKFLGNGGHGLISPLTVEKRERGHDPIFNCWLTARNSENANWKRLTEKPANKKQPILGQPREFAVMNCLVNIDGSAEPRVTVFPKAGLDALKSDLSELTPRSQAQPLDPMWENYLLGDVTSPQYGLWGEVKKVVFNTAGMETSCFIFSKNKKQLVGHQPYPFDPNSPEGQSILANRQHIGDLKRVTRVWTPEEVMELLVDDGFLPYDLIIKACAQYWQVPPERVPKTYSTPPPDTEAGPVESGGGSFGQKPGAAPPPVSTAATTPPAAHAPSTAPGPMSVNLERRFWVALGERVMDTPEEAVAMLVKTHGTSLQIMLHGESAWKIASDYGFGLPATAPAPPPPLPPTAPAVPPPAPAAPATPTAARPVGPPPLGGSTMPARPVLPARPGGTPTMPPPDASNINAGAPAAPAVGINNNVTTSVTNTAALTPEQQTRLAELSAKFAQDPNLLAAGEMAEFTSLFDRKTVNR